MLFEKKNAISRKRNAISIKTKCHFEKTKKLTIKMKCYFNKVKCYFEETKYLSLKQNNVLTCLHWPRSWRSIATLPGRSRRFRDASSTLTQQQGISDCITSTVTTCCVELSVEAALRLP